MFTCSWYLNKLIYLMCFPRFMSLKTIISENLDQSRDMWKLWFSVWVYKQRKTEFQVPERHRMRQKMHWHHVCDLLFTVRSELWLKFIQTLFALCSCSITLKEEVKLWTHLFYSNFAPKRIKYDKFLWQCIDPGSCRIVFDSYSDP